MFSNSDEFIIVCHSVIPNTVLPCYFVNCGGDTSLLIKQRNIWVKERSLGLLGCDARSVHVVTTQKTTTWIYIAVETSCHSS